MGSAARAVEGCSVTDANYGAAVKLFQSRFGRNNTVIRAHESATEPYSCESILRYYCFEKPLCEMNVKKSLRTHSDTCGCLLWPVLLQMILEFMALAYTRNSDSSIEWRVNTLIKFFFSFFFFPNWGSTQGGGIQLSRSANFQKHSLLNTRYCSKLAHQCEHTKAVEHALSNYITHK